MSAFCATYNLKNLVKDVHEDAMSAFCTTYNLKNLVKEPTCFKNVENSSCIDFVLTNKPLYFQTTEIIETCLSDFHRLTITILKSTFRKQEPKIFNYKNFKKVYNRNVRNDLLSEISKKGFHDRNCMEFETLFLVTLNNHAPMTTKYIRANNSPFMNKDISKPIMVRSRLKNKSLREAYKTQRNFCVSLFRQVKKDFYEHLNPAFISDNKKFSGNRLNHFSRTKHPVTQ